MKKSPKNVFKKLRSSLKEFIRKLLVKLKKNPNFIPLLMLVVSFLVFSLNLTDISDTTARIQGKNMGLSMGLSAFITMLLSMLCMICLLNAFPKRQKPNYLMVAITIIFLGIIVFADISYLNCINNSTVKVTKDTLFINTSSDVLSVHIVLTAITAVTVILEPVFAKLLKKINTSVVLEETHVANIELSDEE